LSSGFKRFMPLLADESASQLLLLVPAEQLTSAASLEIESAKGFSPRRFQEAIAKTPKTCRCVAALRAESLPEKKSATDRLKMNQSSLAAMVIYEVV
jgi:hypothetical protein